MVAFCGGGRIQNHQISWYGKLVSTRSVWGSEKASIRGDPTKVRCATLRGDGGRIQSIICWYDAGRWNQWLWDNVEVWKTVCVVADGHTRSLEKENNLEQKEAKWAGQRARSAEGDKDGRQHTVYSTVPVS